MAGETERLSRPELAERAGVAEADIAWMVAQGIVEPDDGAWPFSEADVRKARLAKACQEAGLPVDGIGAAIAIRVFEARRS